MKTTTLTGILVVLSMNAFGMLKEIETKAKIKNVTVYNASAEVNYTKKMSLAKGKTTIIFTDLTPYIVANTMNVSVSNPSVGIIAVTEKINYIKKNKGTNAAINALRDSVARLEYTIGLTQTMYEALEMEKNILFKGESIGGLTEGILVAEIEKASTFFNKRITEINTKLYHLRRKEEQLNKEIRRNNNQIKQLSSNTTKARSEVRVTVVCKSPQTTHLSFRFLTPKAGWAPVYDCKFEGPDQPIKFVFRANVFNASGTPWTDVHLKLSTASPTTGFSTPNLNSNVSASKTTSQSGVKFRQVKVRNTTSEYPIEHEHSIPSDAKPYLMDVSTYDMKAKFHYLLIPKLDPFGFLMADIPEWNKYDLIPGTTNVYNKGSYMGKTFLNTYTENDTLSVYLGKDKNIVAVRKEINTNNEKKLIGNFYLDKTDISIAVKNNSSEALTIQVMDQVPVYKIGEKIKLNLHGIDDAEYNNKEGSLLWSFVLDPDQKKTIDFKYDVKIPKDAIGSYKPRKRRFRTISCPSF